MMVTSGLTRAQVEDPDHEIAFPESVVQLFRGDLGQPYGGFPETLQKKILKGRAPLTVRPGAVLPPADLAKQRAARSEQKAGRAITDVELASYLMYPKVFVDYAKRPRAVRRRRGAPDADVLLRDGARRGAHRSTSSAARR